MPLINPVDFASELLVGAAVLLALVFLWQNWPACLIREKLILIFMQI